MAADATYITQAEFEAYADWQTGTEADLLKVLQRAERDIDGIVGPWPYQSNGMRFGEPKTTNTAGLDANQKAALTRAVAAQAEYRLEMGEEFFVRAQRARSKGPDFEVEGELPYIGPKVWHELTGSGLLKVTARVGRGRDARPPWYGFAYNDESGDYDPPPLRTMKTP